MNKGPIEAAKSKTQLPSNDTPVRIKSDIKPNEKCGGFLVQQEHIDCRRANENGLYVGWVPGAGGDVWWVKHQDGTIGAYMFTELTDV